MICPTCNHSNAVATRFCTACGTSLSVATTPAPLARPRLYVHTGPDRGRSFRLDAARTIIGRGTNSDVQLTDPLVSSRHAAIEIAASHATVTDLESANGTKVAGQRLKPNAPHGTAYGLMIEIGDTIVELVAPDRQPHAAAPTITRSSRTSRGTARFRRRTLVTIASVAAVALLALILGVAALTRDTPTALPTAAGAAPPNQRDAAWVMRTQGHTAVQVFACQGSSESKCDDTMQGGTGSVLDLGGGLILTNFHVIADENNERPLDDLWVAVSVADEDYVRAEVVGFSACDDLAVLRTVDDADALSLAEVTLGDASTLEIGDQVVVLGYPGTVATAASGDQQLQLTAGNVSALGVVVDNYRNLIQMSAPINHGNSGGPIFDLNGTQVGVATLGDASDTQGIFYAISIDQVKTALPDLIDGAKQTGLNSCPS
jgi:S1-C subfamily serine protease